MEHVAIDEIDPAPNDPNLHTDRRDLAAALDTDGVAIARYVLEAGERFSGSVHAHMDQEEVFVVLEGEATFEVRADEGDERDERTDEVTVDTDEVIRFAPGEFQSGYNAGDDRVVALALGVPKESEDVRIARIPVLEDRDISCPDCEFDHMRISRIDGVDFECPDCGATLVLEDA